jgi:hypothetical protein
VPVSVAVAQRVRCADGECPAAKAFDTSIFGFCDASVLARQWQVDMWEAKLRIGEQVLNNNSSFVKQELRLAFARFACNDVFNYRDAPKLAELWAAEPRS